MKNQELLDIKTKQPIDQNSPAFKDFQAKLKAVKREIKKARAQQGRA